MIGFTGVASNACFAATSRHYSGALIATALSYQSTFRIPFQYRSEEVIAKDNSSDTQIGEGPVSPASNAKQETDSPPQIDAEFPG
jgi:hypothetical protein